MIQPTVPEDDPAGGHAATASAGPSAAWAGAAPLRANRQRRPRIARLCHGPLKLLCLVLQHSTAVWGMLGPWACRVTVSGLPRGPGRHQPGCPAARLPCQHACVRKACYAAFQCGIYLAPSLGNSGAGGRAGEALACRAHYNTDSFTASPPHRNASAGRRLGEPSASSSASKLFKYFCTTSGKTGAVGRHSGQQSGCRWRAAQPWGQTQKPGVAAAASQRRRRNTQQAGSMGRGAALPWRRRAAGGGPCEGPQRRAAALLLLARPGKG
jgi:hypothetical protein